jgi:hypothetical protein
LSDSARLDSIGFDWIGLDWIILKDDVSEFGKEVTESMAMPNDETRVVPLQSDLCKSVFLSLMWHMTIRMMNGNNFIL